MTASETWGDHLGLVCLLVSSISNHFQQLRVYRRKVRAKHQKIFLTSRQHLRDYWGDGNHNYLLIKYFEYLLCAASYCRCWVKGDDVY